MIRGVKKFLDSKLVQRHFHISELFNIKKLEGEGPSEPVRLRTTERVADFGSGLIPFAWNQACPRNI